MSRSRKEEIEVLIMELRALIKDLVLQQDEVACTEEVL